MARGWSRRLIGGTLRLFWLEASSMRSTSTTGKLGAFAARLKSHGFAPKVSRTWPALSTQVPYPRDVGPQPSQDAPRSFVYEHAAYSGKSVVRMAESVRQRSVERGAAGGATLKWLELGLPARPVALIDGNDQAYFSHFQRLAIYRRDGYRVAERPCAILHVHHQLTCDPKLDLHKDEDSLLRFDMELADAWLDPQELQANSELFSAVGWLLSSQAADHLGVVMACFEGDYDDEFADELQPALLAYRAQLPTGGGKTSAELAGAIAAAIVREFEDGRVGSVGSTVSGSFSLLNGGPWVGFLPERRSQHLLAVANEGRAALLPKPKERPEPGDEHAVLIVRDRQHYLLGDSEPDVALDDRDASELPPLFWLFVIDSGTNAFYVEAAASEPAEAAEYLALFERAWTPKENGLFQGVPSGVCFPKKYLRETERASLNRALAERSISLTHPSSGFGAGISIGKTWASDVRIAFREARSRSDPFGYRGVWLEEAQTWAEAQQVIAMTMCLGQSAMSQDERYRRLDYYGLWERYTHFNGIDSTAFCKATRVDVGGIVARVLGRAPRECDL